MSELNNSRVEVPSRNNNEPVWMTIAVDQKTGAVVGLCLTRDNPSDQTIVSSLQSSLPPEIGDVDAYVRKGNGSFIL